MARRKTIVSTPDEEVEVIKEVRSLYCPLSEDELAERSQTLASKVELKTQLEEKKKDTTRRITDEIKLNDAQIQDLGTRVLTKKEIREVECHWRRDGTKMILVRMDTGSVVESRPLTPEEKQATLFRSIPEEEPPNELDNPDTMH